LFDTRTIVLELVKCFNKRDGKTGKATHKTKKCKAPIAKHIHTHNRSHIQTPVKLRRKKPHTHTHTHIHTY